MKKRCNLMWFFWYLIATHSTGWRFELGWLGDPDIMLRFLWKCPRAVEYFYPSLCPHQAWGGSQNLWILFGLPKQSSWKDSPLPVFVSTLAIMGLEPSSSDNRSSKDSWGQSHGNGINFISRCAKLPDDLILKLGVIELHYLQNNMGFVTYFDTGDWTPRMSAVTASCRHSLS